MEFLKLNLNNHILGEYTTLGFYFGVFWSAVNLLWVEVYWYPCSEVPSVGECQVWDGLVLSMKEPFCNPSRRNSFYTYLKHILHENWCSCSVVFTVQDKILMSLLPFPESTTEATMNQTRNQNWNKNSRLARGQQRWTISFFILWTSIN